MPRSSARTAAAVVTLLAAMFVLPESRTAFAAKLTNLGLVMDGSVDPPGDRLDMTLLFEAGGVYHSQRRFAEAEPLYKRALAIWEKVLGKGQLPPSQDRPGALGCFALTETGANRGWAVPDAFKCSLGYDGGPAPRVGFRKGVLYCVHECYNEGSRMSRLLAVKPEDGTILSDLDIKGFGFGQFHLWGDRVVQIGDNGHESMGHGCGYRAIVGPPTALTISGQPLFPRTWEKGRKGCSGYVRPIRDPFVDGLQFSRTGNGDIVCWDLRAR